MRPSEIDIDVADANLTGFASNITGAGPWTMTTTAPTDGLAHQLSIRNDSATDYSGQTFTCVGTDADGKALSEAVTGPTGTATVESTGYFKTLTTVTASGAGIGADTFDVGWVDEVASATFPIDRMSDTAANILVDVTGTIDFTVQELWENVYDVAKPQQDATWINITALAAKTADTASTATKGATAVRIIVNSYSSTAELQMYVNQPTSH